MSDEKLPLICIGSVLWDIIGKCNEPMVAGSDKPGRIQKIPGGVALNIAMALRKHGFEIELLSSVGTDRDGDALLSSLTQMGLGTTYLHRSTEYPTDFYMAIESPNGVLGAVADAHSLEDVGAIILASLRDGRLGSADNPFAGSIVLDGNLTSELLVEIAGAPEFKQADIFIAPASPGKADRIEPFLDHPNASIFVNKEEAEILCNARFATSEAAARNLMSFMPKMAVVTDGHRAATVIDKTGAVSLEPEPVQVKRYTGAGDCFMAAFIKKILAGEKLDTCLSYSLTETNAYISTE